MSKLSNLIGLSDDTIYGQVVAGMQNPGDLPNYKAGADFTPYGQQFIKNAEVFNEYIQNVAQKYGMVFQRTAQAQNPLAMFRRGQMPYGGKLEAIVYDTIAPAKYTGTENSDPFEVNFGKVAGETFTENQDITQTNTIVDTQDTLFFQNLSQFHDFVMNKAVALINGAVLDEYFLTKYTLSRVVESGVMTSEVAHGVQDLASKIKRGVKKMQYFTRDYNANGFNQASLVTNLVVLLPVDRSVDLDLTYYSQLFNPELAKAKVEFVEVDSIPDVWVYTKDHTVVEGDFTNGYVDAKAHKLGDVLPAGSQAVPNATDARKSFDGSQVGAIILDRDALQLWDALPLTLSTISNPRGRYTNLIINKKTFFMFVGGLNSLCIMYDENKDANDTLEAKVTVKVTGTDDVQAPTLSGAVGEVVDVPAAPSSASGKTATVTFNGKKVTPGGATGHVTLTNGDNELIYAYA